MSFNTSVTDPFSVLTSSHLQEGGPSTPTQGSQGPSQGERLNQDQGERLGRESERLGRESERLGREGGRLSMELDRLGPLTREKALYMFA